MRQPRRKSREAGVRSRFGFLSVVLSLEGGQEWQLQAGSHWPRPDPSMSVTEEVGWFCVSGGSDFC